MSGALRGAGHIDVALPDSALQRVGITRAHLEEDAGASLPARIAPFRQFSPQQAGRTRRCSLACSGRADCAGNCLDSSHSRPLSNVDDLVMSTAAAQAYVELVFTARDTRMPRC